jgi:hypothetical protein
MYLGFGIWGFVAMLVGDTWYYGMEEYVPQGWS